MCYKNLIYHLDLCIFAYHLHSQTLIWPMDPYYEQMSGKYLTHRRKLFMNEVRGTFKTIQKDNYHGPGFCMGDENNGWPSNYFLDPIISNPVD